MTVYDKAHIASYQVSELIAHHMKAHTSGELLIFPACKKIVTEMLGNKAAICPMIQFTGIYYKCLQISRKSFFFIHILQVQIDESTPITNKEQLIALIGCINEDHNYSKSGFFTKN